MAAHHILHCCVHLLATLIARVFAIDRTLSATSTNPFSCYARIKTCKASLYHVNRGLKQEQVASFYSVNPTQINPFPRAGRLDNLVTVPCYCTTINGITAYFYDVPYKVTPGDIFSNVNSQIFGGQAWPSGDEASSFVAGDVVTLHILCGCLQNDSKVLVSYTVEEEDTLSDVAILPSSSVSEIRSINNILGQNTSFLNVGLVLFVPTERHIVLPPGNNPAAAAKRASGRKRAWLIIAGIIVPVTLILMITATIILIRRCGSENSDQEAPKSVSNS